MPTTNQDQESGTAAKSASLPSNVSIFSPKDPSTASNLLNGRLFTRLAASVQTEPSKLTTALKSCETFSFIHGTTVLIFDAGEEAQEAHHEHFRSVCLALKDHDIGLDVAGCIFDATEVVQAGFQLDRLSDGAVLVINLMGGANDDEDSEDEDGDGDASAVITGFSMGDGDGDATFS